MRIDKFLKVSRILKRRTVAQEACTEEKVLINGKPAKPSTAVKIGDVVEVLYSSGVLKFRVLNIKETVKQMLTEYLQKNGHLYLFAHTAILQILAQNVERIDGVVTNDLNGVAVVESQNNAVNTRLLDGESHCGSDNRACLENNLTRKGADNVLCQAVVCNAVANCHLFIKFIIQIKKCYFKHY